MVDDLSSTELKVQPDGPCQHLDLYQKTCVRTNATGQMLQLNSHIRQKYNGWPKRVTAVLLSCSTVTWCHLSISLHRDKVSTRL